MTEGWIRSLLVSTLAASAAVFCGTSAMANTLLIPGTNVGAIPDNDPSGLTISFAVTSTRQVSRVSVGLDMAHTWMGDLDAILRSPNGEAQLVLFSRVGAETFSARGDSSDFDGSYSFLDPSPGVPSADLWAVAASSGSAVVIPTVGYRSSTPGMPNLSNHGGCSTQMDAAFGDAIPQSDGVMASGTWTLTISDLASGDTGRVTAATLRIVEAEDIFKNGFDSLEVPQQFTNCIRTTHDLTGNGLADYTTLVDNAGTIEWTVLENTGGGTAGNPSSFTFGVSSTDSFNSADVDGDGIDDPVVFTLSTGVFNVRRSSRPGSLPLQVNFGPRLAGEILNPNMLGDYDGDGLDDLAIERQRVIAPLGLSYLEYTRSSDGVGVVFAASANTGNLRSAGGEDFLGTGKADLIQRTSSGTEFFRYQGTDGSPFVPFTFGTPSDRQLFAAERTGDQFADVTAVRESGSDLVWETRSAGGATSSPLTFGALVAGYSTYASAADYDGDGRLDYSYWLRDDAGPGPSQFFVMPTTAPGTTWTVDASAEFLPLSVARSF